MLLKKILHWLCFFTVLASFTFLAVQGTDISSVTSIEEVHAQSVEGNGHNAKPEKLELCWPREGETCITIEVGDFFTLPFFHGGVS